MLLSQADLILYVGSQRQQRKQNSSKVLHWHSNGKEKNSTYISLFLEE